MSLEHRYGATLLAAVLTGDPVTELGDDVVPRSVRFQASSVSPVDDLVVEADDGGGVRREPTVRELRDLAVVARASSGPRTSAPASVSPA